MWKKVLPVLLLTAALGLADDSGLLIVKGRGIEGRKPQYSGGKVEFTDASLPAQVVHYAGASEIVLPLRLAYTVIEPAPILLNSRTGTEYWRLYHFADETMCPLYTRENIDLSKPGSRVAVPKKNRAWFAPQRAPLPRKGLVGIRGHYYFLVDPLQGDHYLDVTTPPPFFDKLTVGRNLSFTLANLKNDKFRLGLRDFRSTWTPGGPFQVKLVVVDAEGAVFPVPNVPGMVSAGKWKRPLRSVWTPLNEPTGQLRGTLPDPLPAGIQIVCLPTVVTAKGKLKQFKVAAYFGRGQGKVNARTFAAVAQGYKLPRGDDGKIRETRALWMSMGDMLSVKKMDSVVKRAHAARLNLLLPDIFVRNRFAGNNKLGLPPARLDDGGDPLARLIEKAHAAHLEVHPWFCVSYRDRAFNEWFEKKYGVDARLHKKDGSIDPVASDVHCPRYRDFIVDLMVGVARDYEVDGIHLDYIRSKGKCYCDRCKTEFAAKFGKPLEQATEADWSRWQREAIGDIVHRTAEGVRAVRPGAKISVAVFSNMRGGALQGQDPGAWARNAWVDMVIPMDYAMQPLMIQANERAFLNALGKQCGDRLVTGLSLYRKTAKGPVSRSPDRVKMQIELVRRMGIHGYCLFVSDYLDDKIVEMLRIEENRESAVPYFSVPER